jgi:hypothetical protein
MRCVAVLVIAAGCGRLGFGSNGDDPDGATGGPDGAGAIDAPAIDSPDEPDATPTCQWTPVAGVSPLPGTGLSLGVTGTSTGYTITFAPSGGGDMYGFNMDSEMQTDSDWFVTSSGNSYVGTSTVWTGAKMTTMVTSSPSTYIKRYNADLTSYVQTDSQSGYGARPAYATASSRWYYGINNDTGLLLSEMTPDGVPVGVTRQLAQGNVGVARAAASIAGDDLGLVAAWQHDNNPGIACYYALVTPDATMSQATERPIPGGSCDAIRIAGDGSGGAIVAYQQTGLVKYAHGTAASTDAPVTLGSGSDPRVVRIGGTYLAWRETDRIAAAFLATPGAEPDPIAIAPLDVMDYELIRNSDGVPLVFAITASGGVVWASLEGC